MRFFIDGSHRYYYNSDGFIEFKTVKGRFIKRKILVRDNIQHCSYEIIDDVINRKRKITLPLYLLHLKYVYSIDLSDKCVSFKDGNYNNFLDYNNIVIESLFDICDNIVITSELGERYKLCSNGNIYDSLKCNFYLFRNNFSYRKINGFNVHHLVWKYFNGGLIPDGYVIDHIDNNCINNDINNLQVISQNLNIKKEKQNKCINKRIICINGKSYVIGNTKFNKVESDLAYSNALKLLDDGVFHDFITDHYYINYNFAYCFWYISRLPNSNHKIIDLDYKSLRFDSYSECEKTFNEICEKYGLSLIKSGTYEFYKNRGRICFKHLGEKYQITLRKGLDEYNDYIIKYFLSHNKEDVIKEMPTIKSKSKDLLNDLNKENELKQTLKYQTYIKEIAEKQKIKKKEQEVKKIENIKRFNEKVNYKIIQHGSVFSFNIPYNLKYYYLGNISHEEIALQVNNDILENKSKINFLEWLKDYKNNEFVTYKELDIKKTNNDIRTKAAGYYWFSNRNCWKSHIGFNGKKYLLGYFKCEDACKMIYDEAKRMIEYDKFDIWYLNIKSHRLRVKSFC